MSEKVISMTDEVVSLFQQEQDDDNKKTSCLIDIGRAEDADTSLAIDTKSHESAIADPTAAAQHRSTQLPPQAMATSGADRIGRKRREGSRRKREGKKG